MISEPRITPLARPISASTPETTFVTKPSATAGDVSSAAALASCERFLVDASSSTAFSIAASTEPPIPSVCWITPRTVATTTSAHQREEAENDQARAECGLEPAALEVTDQGLEDHRQNCREQQRKHDLADRSERDDHDDRRRDDSDEAPGPDSESRHAGHRSTPPGSALLVHATSLAAPPMPDIIQTG